ncbi:hypothetical protein Tco_1174057 [Tanacetum coccineum]
MKMEILLEPTSNKLMVGNGTRSILTDSIGFLQPKPGRLSKHIRPPALLLTKEEVSKKCVKLKYFKKEKMPNIKAFQELWYEQYHVGPEEVQSPQDGTQSYRWRTDYAWLMIQDAKDHNVKIQVQGTRSIQEVNEYLQHIHQVKVKGTSTISTNCTTKRYDTVSDLQKLDTNIRVSRSQLIETRVTSNVLMPLSFRLHLAKFV